MDNTISFTPAQLISIILGICAAIVTISAAVGVIVKAIEKARAPEVAQNERLDKIEERLAKLDEIKLEVKAMLPEPKPEPKKEEIKTPETKKEEIKKPEPKKEEIKKPEPKKEEHKIIEPKKPEINKIFEPKKEDNKRPSTTIGGGGQNFLALLSKFDINEFLFILL